MTDDTEPKWKLDEDQLATTLEYARKPDTLGIVFIVVTPDGPVIDSDFPAASFAQINSAMTVSQAVMVQRQIDKQMDYRQQERMARAMATAQAVMHVVSASAKCDDPSCPTCHPVPAAKH